MNRTVRNRSISTRTVSTRTVSTAVLSAATVAVLTLSGCSSSGGGSAAGTTAAAATTGTPASGPHNTADVTFATDMIPHHQQAVQMADMALAQATSAQVKTLAGRIKNAQDPEIATMSGWLAGWGQTVPSSTSTMGGMGHSGSSMGSGNGMMSDADMSTLAAASGAAFDQMWVSTMIEHHTGAIDMAKTELSDGQNTDAQQLAQSIIDGQTAEITTMKQLQTTLPAAA